MTETEGNCQISQWGFVAGRSNSKPTGSHGSSVETGQSERSDQRSALTTEKARTALQPTNLHGQFASSISSRAGKRISVTVTPRDNSGQSLPVWICESGAINGHITASLSQISDLIEHASGRFCPSVSEPPIFATNKIGGGSIC